MPRQNPEVEFSGEGWLSYNSFPLPQAENARSTGRTRKKIDNWCMKRMVENIRYCNYGACGP